MANGGLENPLCSWDRTLAAKIMLGSSRVPMGWTFRQIKARLRVLCQPKLATADRLFLNGHTLDGIREISRQFSAHQDLLDLLIEGFQRQGNFACDLMDFVEPGMTFRDFIHCANDAFFIWNTELNKRRPDRKKLANSMRRLLFYKSPKGWQRYVNYMRRDVPWFDR
jgi:hypothetical protein